MATLIPLAVLSGGEGGGGSVSWASVTGKPTTFPPEAHTQDISTITGLQAALDGKQASGSYAAATHTHSTTDITQLAEFIRDTVAAALVAGANVEITNNDPGDTITIAATGGGGGDGLDAEAVRDTIGTALVAGTGISINVVDASDTITISISGLTIADVSGLQTALDGKAATSHNHNASAVNAGTLDIARIPTGTSGTTVALGNHTHADKADDSAVVKLTGNQTVAGTKTFSSAPVVPDASFTIAKTNGLQTALDGKVDSAGIDTITVITQAAYDALGSGRSNRILYVISG